MCLCSEASKQYWYTVIEWRINHANTVKGRRSQDKNCKCCNSLTSISPTMITQFTLNTGISKIIKSHNFGEKKIHEFYPLWISRYFFLSPEFEI